MCFFSHGIGKVLDSLILFSFFSVPFTFLSSLQSYASDYTFKLLPHCSGDRQKSKRGTGGGQIWVSWAWLRLFWLGHNYIAGRPAGLARKAKHIRAYVIVTSIIIIIFFFPFSS